MKVFINDKKYDAMPEETIIELSDRVFDKLKLNENENLVKLELINANETFILGEAKTYNAEKKISSTAPINNVSVISLGPENQDITAENFLSEDDINLVSTTIDPEGDEITYLWESSLDGVISNQSSWAGYLSRGDLHSD